MATRLRDIQPTLISVLFPNAVVHVLRRSGAAVHIALVKIDPETAKKMIAYVPHWQRDIQPTTTKRIARDLSAGDFQFNGDTIVITSDQEVSNGQHRLHACVASGVSFETLIVEGVAREAFPTYDGTPPRQLSVVLEMQGEQYCGMLAATLRRLAHYLREGIFGVATITNPEGLDLLSENPGLRRSCAVAATAKDYRFKAALAFLHFVISTRNDSHSRRVKADDFVEKIATGANLEPGHPVLALRSRMFADHAETGKLSERYMVAITINAWNAFLAGRKLKLAKWDEERQPFPEIE